MPLTKSDLNQIRTIVKTEVKAETRPLASDVKKLINGQADLKKGLRRVERKLNKSAHFLDKSDIKLQKRIHRVEKKLGLPPLPDFQI